MIWEKKTKTFRHINTSVSTRPLVWYNSLSRKSWSQSSTFWDIPEKYGFHFLLRKLSISINLLKDQTKINSMILLYLVSSLMFHNGGRDKTWLWLYHSDICVICSWWLTKIHPQIKGPWDKENYFRATPPFSIVNIGVISCSSSSLYITMQIWGVARK